MFDVWVDALGYRLCARLAVARGAVLDVGATTDLATQRGATTVWPPRFLCGPSRGTGSVHPSVGPADWNVTTVDVGMKFVVDWMVYKSEVG